MSTYTVTDGQSLKFISPFLGGDPAAVIEASGACQVSIDEFSPRAARTVDLNLAANARGATSFGSVGDVRLTVNGDATTTLIAAGFGASPGGQAVIQPDVAGTGTFGFSNNTFLEFGRGVGSGVTVILDGRRDSAATLRLDRPGDSKGAVIFKDGQVVLDGLAEAAGYSLSGGVLWIYGPGDQVIDALRFADTSPEQAGLALRLVGREVRVVEQGSAPATSPEFLGGTALARHAPPSVLVSDGTTGLPVTTVAAQPYAGSVAELQQQAIAVTAQNLNVLANAPNLFIRTGSGDDAIQAAGGTNVLDGAAGSNFFIAGAGTDTFFVGARSAAGDTWSTVAKFHSGDVATLWGVSATTPAQWADSQGAGATGLTLHTGAAGSPKGAAFTAGPMTSLTLAGFTTADLASGKVTASFGHDAASGSDYLYLRAS